MSGSDEEALIAARHQIDHCVRLGVAVLVDMGHPRSDYAADHGVMIGVKPHGGITTTAADCVEAVARVDRDAYRICLDPGNLVHFSGAATADDFALVAPSGPSAVESVNMFDDPARTDTEAATVLHYLRGLLGVSS